VSEDDSHSIRQNIHSPSPFDRGAPSHASTAAGTFGARSLRRWSAEAVEVQSPNHSSFVELQRGADGTLTDAGGFGNGAFSIRSAGVDNQVVVDDFAWPAGGIAGAFLNGKGNFQ
jgi:hypothetical protein